MDCLAVRRYKGGKTELTATRITSVCCCESCMCSQVSHAYLHGESSASGRLDDGSIVSQVSHHNSFTAFEVLVSVDGESFTSAAALPVQLARSGSFWEGHPTGPLDTCGLKGLHLA